MNVELVPARRHHCGAVLKRLRAGHRAAIDGLGTNPHKELWDCFDASAYRRSMLIDGRVAAIGGVLGTTMQDDGFVWLAITDEATRYPLTVVRKGIEALREIFATKRRLSTIVLGDDVVARRFALFMGFVPGGEDSAFRVSVGNGYAEPMTMTVES